MIKLAKINKGKNFEETTDKPRRNGYVLLKEIMSPNS